MWLQVWRHTSLNSREGSVHGQGKFKWLRQWGLSTCDSWLFNGTGGRLCSLCAVVWPGSAEAHLWQGYLLMHSAFSLLVRNRYVQGSCKQLQAALALAKVCSTGGRRKCIVPPAR